MDAPPEHAHAIFDIPTPTLGGSSTGTTINLSWTNSHVIWGGGVDENNQPIPTTDMGEFWGTTQLSMVEGSGHTDVHIWDELEAKFVKIGQSTNGTYQLTNQEPGTYKFMVKEKSLEGFSPNAKTHHSENSNEFEVEVGACKWTLTNVGVAGGQDANLVGFTASLKAKSNDPDFNFHLRLASSCNDEVLVGRTVRVRVVNNNAGWVQVTDGDQDGSYPVNGIEYGQTTVGGPWPMEIEVLNGIVWEPIDYTQQPWEFKSTL